MRKKELTERLAQQTQQSEGAAADELDGAIHRVLKSLRQAPLKAAELHRLMKELNANSGRKGRHAE